MICGDTGTGKSFCALSMAEKLDPTFNVNRIHFDHNQLLRAIRDSKPGEAHVMDEAGATFGARDFMSAGNKELSKIFQVFRYKNLYLIWTLPDMAMIDINARRLMHTYVETQKVDFKRKLTIVRWFQVLIKRREGEIYYVLVRGKDKLGHRYKLDPVHIPKPSDALLVDYEVLKNSYFHKLIKDALNKQHKGKGDGGDEDDIELGISITDAAEQAGIDLNGLKKEETPAEANTGKVTQQEKEKLARRQQARKERRMKAKADNASPITDDQMLLDMLKDQ